MIIKTDKVNKKMIRVWEHLGISLVVFLCAYLGLLYLGMKFERRSHGDGILTYLLNSPWIYASICIAIVIAVNLGIFINRFNKKNVFAIDFKDDSKEVVVYLMPYYSMKAESVTVLYSEFSLQINKKVSELQDKYLHLTIRQGGLPVGVVNGNDAYWAGQKKLLDKIIRKSAEIEKSKS